MLEELNSTQEEADTRLLPHSRQNNTALHGLTQFEDKDTFLKSSQTFALLLFGKKAKHVSSLNELRFILATTTDKAA